MNPRQTDDKRTLAEIALRDYFAARAPITYDEVVRIYGCAMPNDDVGRASFMTVWALLRYEYADAMLVQRREGQSWA